MFQKIAIVDWNIMVTNTYKQTKKKKKYAERIEQQQKKSTWYLW